MNKRSGWLLAGLLTSLCLALLGQEREDRTLLRWPQVREIINEASGERAMHHVLELVPYPRVRARQEYTGHFRESEVMARFAREYGFSNVEIESLPGPQIWHAWQAELWMVQPEARKLYDVYDVAVAIASGSESGDVTAEVVDVGIGSGAEDYAGKDVKGKIVLGSAPSRALQRLAVIERGAVGVLSYNALRPDSVPDGIMAQGISASAPKDKKPGFGWSIAARLGREIAARLARGEKVALRSMVKSETFPGKMEIVHAVIPGDGSTDQAIAVSAHLYEGYQKQGANDDNSGCAATLEMGRTLIRLAKEGKLPPPRRAIHFLWVPEISGTTAWLRKHEDVKSKLIADLNFDMAGLGLRAGGAFFLLHRTPDTFPTFLNDVSASVLEFVGNTNQERVRYRHNGYRFTLPVVAPNGSQDPFYYKVDKHYGASDHVVYLNQGIPAVMFNTWPDPWYHSSQDTPDKLDATQFKRAVVVGAAAAQVLAVADEEMAARVAAESLARGTARMAEAQRKGLAYLADADSAALAAAYREALVVVRHQAEVEKQVIRSSAVLFSTPAEAGKRLAPLEGLVEQRAAALLNEVKAVYQFQAEQRKATAPEPAPSEAEARAARLIPERTGPAPFGMAAFMAAEQALEKLPAQERLAVQEALRKIPAHMTSELNILLGKKKTVLEIRDFLSGEFEPLPLDDLVAYLRAQEKLGNVKLVEKPEEPKPAPPVVKKRAKKG